ncbi:MAG: energy-coupling factor ABC transporter permease [Methanosarcina mazei]|uniref:Putative cobalt transport protein CbiM n=3 Tax=Methanosarcina mazei TaxID=2209 RepID=A0A0E3RQW3_METMZ|nr:MULTISPECIES: energy-coupling factor ABC transporter permease [Methanosarcina]AAM30161.1 CbiM protein [Methanosarcina mazei Go1]AKB67382.1 Substrate-specific component CbiM of cobalt ECF transporter [Methanosarcina mazei LYC]MDY0247590.1 energy-coupling factor ABC transporter permease [Methanosarcina mazei]NLO31539.1 energy-coupling factor ABC transporter permease [Methanosarcina mazei]WIM43735.1 energy-coupling factor ABC transporter permease [Methanosarcina mazei]
MHIMEGFLPTPWWQLWFAVSIPVILYGIYKMNNLVKEKREILPLLAVAGAFIFVLSSLKLPSVTGSCSHPTGTGVAAIIFGPAISAVLGTIVLLYQALFLAHGGLTTLGANVFSMGIVGPVVAYLVYKAGMKANINFFVVVFLATAFGDWATYLTTSVQLSLAYPAGGALTIAGFMSSFGKFATVFAVTQVPLAIMEGAISALLFKYVVNVKSDILVEMKVIEDAVVRKLRGISA